MTQEAVADVPYCLHSDSDESQEEQALKRSAGGGGRPRIGINMVQPPDGDLEGRGEKVRKRGHSKSLFSEP